MGLPKGRTNNPAGKPPGTQNKVGADRKKAIAEILESKADRFSTAMESLDDKEFVKAYIDLLAYNIPKMASAHLDIETNEDAKKTVHDLFPDELKDGESES